MKGGREEFRGTEERVERVVDEQASVQKVEQSEQYDLVDRPNWREGGERVGVQIVRAGDVRNSRLSVVVVVVVEVLLSLQLQLVVVAVLFVVVRSLRRSCSCSCCSLEQLQRMMDLLLCYQMFWNGNRIAPNNQLNSK